MRAGVLLASVLATGTASAATLSVGPDQPYASPSAAAREAHDGDTVAIAPGTYYDCAVWGQNNLTIVGTAPGVAITDRTCQGKAIFVIVGNNVAIRDLTLARARVPDRNGAGIRLEGQGLTLRNVRFENNEVGLLAGTPGPGTIRIESCTFTQGGVGGERPTYAVSVAAVGLLRIEASTFEHTKGGQIASAAGRTELIGNTIATGTGDAPGVAAMGTGGLLIADGNRFSVGPNASRFQAAAVAMGRGPPIFRHNTLINATGRPQALLLNWTGTTARLEDNRIPPGDTQVSVAGFARHMASVLFHDTIDGMRGVARRIPR